MQHSKIYAMVGVVAVTLIVVLAIVFFRSGSDFIEIPINLHNMCTTTNDFDEMPKWLIVGPCEKNDDGNCRIKASPDFFEIKAEFPPAMIPVEATVSLLWQGDGVVDGDACKAGLICSDTEGKKDQSLHWKPAIRELKVGKGSMTLYIFGPSGDIYCVVFPAEVVA